MPFDASTSRHNGQVPPPEPPMPGGVPGDALPPMNNSLVGSIALRWLVAALGLLGGGGIAGYTINDSAEVDQLYTRIDAIEARLDTTDSQLAATLKANQDAMQAVQDVAMLALELSVDGHRYLTDTMVDAARLDHPDFVPRARPERLERRLDRGTRILDDEMYSR